MGWFDRFRKKSSPPNCQPPASQGSATPDDLPDVVAESTVGEKTPGWHCQFPGTGPDSPRRQFVIGLDFGTAFTKVVIGGATNSYAVPFPEYAGEENPYLLPGRLSFTKSGHAHLANGKDGGGHMDLKMRLLDGDMGDETIVLIATFLALVLQSARAWFLNSHKDTYGQFRLDWCVNVGLPTQQYHNEHLKNFYREIVKAAWLASASPEPLSRDLVESCFADPEGSLEDDDIGLFPEFVAQVNSYVKSPMRARGRNLLHLLVDVGAGTVDVAVFTVYENEQGDLFPIYAKSVSKRGVQYLPVEPEDQREFANMFRKQIQRDIDFVRQNKYPEYWNPERRNVLPFFLCGGGSYVNFYRAIANGMVERAFPCALRRLELPVPQRLVAQNLPAAAYHRLSVAYGLSFDPFDIGQIVPEDEVEHNDSAGSRLKNAECPLCKGTGGPRGNDCYRCGGSGMLTT